MMSDRDLCQDVIKDLKYMTMCQAFCAGEASPNAKHIFLDQLRSHQDLHTQFIRLMEQRGWYPRVPGDLGFNQQYGAPYTGSSWQAANPWQAGSNPMGGNWQNLSSGPWQGAGWSQPSGSTFQTLQQNLQGNLQGGGRPDSR